VDALGVGAHPADLGFKRVDARQGPFVYGSLDRMGWDAQLGEQPNQSLVDGWRLSVAAVVVVPPVPPLPPVPEPTKVAALLLAATAAPPLPPVPEPVVNVLWGSNWSKSCVQPT
jgi:hypothetical protein